MKTIFRYVKAFVFLLILFFVFGVVSCLLPDTRIKRNIAESAQVIAPEGNYPHAFMNKDQCQLDNFTDALVMNQIYNIDRHRPVHSFMMMYRKAEPGWDQTGSLLRLVNGEQINTTSYARYWHGSTAVFRVFFMFMNFTNLKFVMFIISLLLFVYFSILTYKKLGLLYALLSTMAFALVYGFMMQFSMQFFPILVITLTAAIMILLKAENTHVGLLFFVVGMVTAYFDLLSTPLMSLGVPLTIWLALQHGEKHSCMKPAGSVVGYSVVWGIGYALTFFSKWVLATLLTGENIIADGMTTSIHRSGVGDYSRFDAISKNIDMISFEALAVVVFVVVIFWAVAKIRHRSTVGCGIGGKLLAYLLLVSMPYVWYFLASNHSYEHWWFTFRTQYIAILSLLFLVAELVGKHTEQACSVSKSESCDDSVSPAQ